MRPIIRFANWLTDMDWGWWPVVHLRPPKDHNIDNRVLFRITPYFGSVAGIIIFLMGFAPNYSIGSLLISFLIGWPTFFLLYKWTFAAAWNQRAADLRRGGTVK